MRTAVITPYYKETDAVLRRCLDSVARQTVPVTHFMIADGFPRDDLLAEYDVRHIKLPAPHRDNGNTPRAAGSISALNLGFEAFAFLDADNWFDPEHVESLLETIQSSGADVALSDRRIYLPDGTLVPDEDPWDIARTHADTSCMLFTSRVAHLLPLWGMMHQPLSPACDQIMFQKITASRIPYAWSRKPTMHFVGNYGLYFEMAGRPRPENVNDVPPQQIIAGYNQAEHKARTRMDFMVFSNLI